MKHKHQISVFEHQYLKVGEDGFNQIHFNRILHYNEQYGNKFFIAGYNKIKFTNYVGVIQVGNLTIEVLPKADNSSDFDKWRLALLTMLFQCKKVSLKSISEAHLKLRSTSILELILESFLNEVEYLISIGLVKGYRYLSSNKSSLKGKILFSEHLTKNVAHKEYFYTRHETYDYSIVWNQIIKKALQILLSIARNVVLVSRAAKLLWYFDEIESIAIDSKIFNNLRYNRKTEAYKRGIKLSELIILSYSPDIQFGMNNVMAVLFDMNTLFEEYVFRIMKKEERNYLSIDLEIMAQQSRKFWGARKIRPDIVLQFEEKGKQKLIIDTKWKILRDYRPSDDDLRQMFAYNIHFDADKSVLLYPQTDLINQSPVQFMPSKSVIKNHSCQLVFADLFDKEGKAKKDAAQNLLDYILHSV